MTKIPELTVTGKWFDNERQMFQDGIGLRVVTEDGLYQGAAADCRQRPLRSRSRQRLSFRVRRLLSHG
jgi:hypothetical protein